MNQILQRLSQEKQTTLQAVYRKSVELLDHSPRFRFFTLHGKEHIDSLFRIWEIILSQIDYISEDEIYFLSLAICTHDLGMVVSLQEKDVTEVSEGRVSVSDPVHFENFVREVHHQIIDRYFQNDANFISSIGINTGEVSIVGKIGSAHRKIRLRDSSGYTRRLGALLRIIDELDIGPRRAPLTVLENIYHELDRISIFHWYKHAITEDWHIGNNVVFGESNGVKTITFTVAVHPSEQNSIDYWSTQVSRPILKALNDEDVNTILHKEFNLEIILDRSHELCSPVRPSRTLAEIETIAISSGRKVILVIDDESKKLEDSFFPLMDKYHVATAPNIHAGFQYLNANPVDVAIIDLQISGYGYWSEAETQDHKMTGFLVAKTIQSEFTGVKIVILTGTKHPISDEETNSVDVFLRKPIDPFELADAINNLFETNGH